MRRKEEVRGVGGDNDGLLLLLLLPPPRLIVEGGAWLGLNRYATWSRVT